MASNERDHWVIPASAGIKDIHGNPRQVSVRMVSGQVAFSVSTVEADHLVDARASLALPNEAAWQLAHYLWTAVNANQQHGR